MKLTVSMRYFRPPVTKNPTEVVIKIRKCINLSGGLNHVHNSFKLLYKVGLYVPYPLCRLIIVTGSPREYYGNYRLQE